MAPQLLMQVLPFVHPTIAGIALATGLIPILIHLINRRRFVRVPWAAMSFLLAANRRSVKRIWLEQFLLLAARVAIIVLLGLAIARPYLPSNSLLPVRSSRIHRVVLLDNSLSMSAQTPDGVTRFGLAKDYIEQLLDSFPQTDAVSVVTLARPAEAVVASASFDRRFVREQIAGVEPTQRGTDATGALALATNILRDSPAAPGNRAVYLVSDLSRRVWQAPPGELTTSGLQALQRLADTLAQPAIDLAIAPITSEIGGNLSVTALAVESDLIGINTPVRMTATITNHSLQTARNVGLQFRRDGQIVRRERLARIGPGESAIATMTTQFAAAGTHLIEARLTDTSTDALPADNMRYLSVDVRRTAPVLLVDGRPGATRLDGQAGFLATALAPRLPDGEPTLLEPKIITDAELPGEALPSYDLIALCNVQRLAEESWNQLEAFVAGGGGLMVFGGDLVHVDNYNRFGHADGEGVLPGTLARPIVSSDNDEPIGFLPTDLTHPIVRDFAAYAESGLFVARVDRYLPITVDRDRAEVVLRFTNQDPALVVSRLGRGRILFAATTANMDWTNLPAKGDFVSLMISAAAYLSPARGAHRNVHVGDTLHERLTPAESAQSIRVTSSDGSSDSAALVSDGDALALTYGPVERARAISVSIGAGSRVFASNLDPVEAELATIEAETFLTLLDRPARVIRSPQELGGGSTVSRSTELASLSVYLVCALLFIEMTMAMWFGSGLTGKRKRNPDPSAWPTARTRA